MSSKDSFPARSVSSGTATRRVLAIAIASWPTWAMAGDFHLNEQGFYILDFALMVGLLWWFLRGPLKTFLENRRAHVLREIEEAQKLKATAEAVLTEYEAKLRDLEAERKRILADFTKAGEHEQERILAEAQRTADRIVHEAERRVDQESKRLLELLEQEVIASAMTAAEELVRTRATADVNRRLVDEAVRAVEKSGSRLAALQ